MAKRKYAIGVDFGTESGRAVLVEAATGKEVGTAVYAYANGVIDQALPGSRRRLEPDWALQDPEDYLRVFKRAIPKVLRETGVDPDDVIGLGIDFTACTMLPVTADGTPLSRLPAYARMTDGESRAGSNDSVTSRTLSRSAGVAVIVSLTVSNTR